MAKESRLGKDEKWFWKRRWGERWERNNEFAKNWRLELLSKYEGTHGIWPFILPENHFRVLH